MYQQTLYKILPNHIKSKILKRNNRYKKWEAGYNEEHDIVIKYEQQKNQTEYNPSWAKSS